MVEESRIYLDDASNTEAPRFHVRNPFGTDVLLDLGSPVFIDVARFNQVARRSPTPNPRQRVHKFPAHSGCHWTSEMLGASEAR